MLLEKRGGQQILDPVSLRLRLAAVSFHSNTRKGSQQQRRAVRLILGTERSKKKKVALIRNLLSHVQSESKERRIMNAGLRRENAPKRRRRGRRPVRTRSALRCLLLFRQRRQRQQRDLDGERSGEERMPAASQSICLHATSLCPAILSGTRIMDECTISHNT